MKTSSQCLCRLIINNNNQNNGDVHVTNHYVFNVGVSIEELACLIFSLPKPCQDEIHISFSQKQQEDLVILLYDFKGSETVLFDGKWNQNVESIVLPSHIMGDTLEVRSIYDDRQKC